MSDASWAEPTDLRRRLPTLAAVAGIVDGERWIVERLRFLRERQAGVLTDEERAMVDEEVDRLAAERGLLPHGLRAPRSLRRLRRRPG